LRLVEAAVRSATKKRKGKLIRLDYAGRNAEKSEPLSSGMRPQKKARAAGGDVRVKSE